MHHFRSVSEPVVPFAKYPADDEACETTPQGTTRHDVSLSASFDSLWRQPAGMTTPVRRAVPAAELDATFEPQIRQPGPQLPVAPLLRVATEPAPPAIEMLPKNASVSEVAHTTAGGASGIKALAAQAQAQAQASQVSLLDAPSRRTRIDVTMDTYRQPATFVGEPLIFWGARLLLTEYARDAAQSPPVERDAVLYNSHQSAWRALAQQPVHHLLRWPDDAYDRQGLWRPGQHSVSFNLNPAVLGRRLCDYFQVPHPDDPDSDVRLVEGLKLFFEHVSPHTLMPWKVDFHQELNDDLFDIEQIRSAIDQRGSAISQGVIVQVPLSLSMAPWINELDPSAVKVTRAPGMSRGMSTLR